MADWFQLSTRHRRCFVRQLYEPSTSAFDELFVLNCRRQQYCERIQFLEGELADQVVNLDDLATLAMGIISPSVRQRSTFLNWDTRIRNRAQLITMQITSYQTRLTSLKLKISALTKNFDHETGSKLKRRYSCCF